MPQFDKELQKEVNRIIKINPDKMNVVDYLILCHAGKKAMEEKKQRKNL